MSKKVFLFLIVFLFCFSLTVWGANSQTPKAGENKKETRIITDTAGRKVTVPAKIKKVYSVSPVGTIFMYTLAPDKIAGRNWETSVGEKKYTLKKYQKLPVLGGTFGKDKTMNKEEVLKVKPDLILLMGETNRTAVSNAEKIQKQLKIPVVVVGMELTSLDQTYEFMGKLLGVEKRAGELAQYCRQTISEVKAKAAAIPANKRVKVYYAQGNEGLETDPKGSRHTEVLDLVGGINIADVEMQSGYGRTRVSLEQIFAWNPEIIIVCHDQEYQEKGVPYQLILKDANWTKLQAVKNKKVFQIPYEPFNWFDRPPSVNRIIGVKWLANLLYPNYFKYDLKQETKEFYQKFYHIKITDGDVEELLKQAK